MRPTRSARRIWGFRTGAAVCGLVVAVIVAEVGLRIAGLAPGYSQSDWRAKLREIHRRSSDSRLLYELTPDRATRFEYRGAEVEYRVNNDGLRSDRRYSRPKPAGVRRIVLLGDSVVFGLGVRVEDIFATRLEAMLPNNEVINAGVGGYNTYNERIWFESRGTAYQPDAVVLVYCPNDVDEPLEHFQVHVAESLEFPPGSIPNPAYHAELLQKANSGGGSSRMAELADFAGGHSSLINLCLRPISFGRRSRTYERAVRAAADVSSAEFTWLGGELGKLAEAAKRIRAEPFFMYVPLRYELDPRDPAHAELGGHVRALARERGYTEVEIATKLATVWNSHIDVSHLSREGHAVVAKCLAEAIRRDSGR